MTQEGYEVGTQVPYIDRVLMIGMPVLRSRVIVRHEDRIVR
jgi:hypothetical protein